MLILDTGYCEPMEAKGFPWEKPAHWWKRDDLEQHDQDEWQFRSVSPPTLEKQFNKLSAQWKADIGPESTTVRIMTHPAYLEIIKLGEGVIPFILKDLQKHPNHWFIALKALANNFSPVKPEDAGNIKKMTKAWLKWGKDNGKFA
jgi:hypothetical protein